MEEVVRKVGVGYAQAGLPTCEPPSVCDGRATLGHGHRRGSSRDPGQLSSEDGAANAVAPASNNKHTLLDTSAVRRSALSQLLHIKLIPMSTRPHPKLYEQDVPNPERSGRARPRVWPPERATISWSFRPMR